HEGILMTGASHAAVEAALRRVRLPRSRLTGGGRRAPSTKDRPLRESRSDAQPWACGIGSEMPASGSPPARTGQAKALPTDRHQVRVKGRDEQILPDVEPGQPAAGRSQQAARMFRELVLARIIEPASKLDSARVLEEAGVVPASYPTVNRRLRVYATGSWREKLSAACVARAGL